MHSQESFDYTNFDWKQIKTHCNEQKKYFCSYDEENYQCGCAPKTFRLSTDDKEIFNILFIAKLGDMEVYPIIYAMTQ